MLLPLSVCLGIRLASFCLLSLLFFPRPLLQYIISTYNSIIFVAWLLVLLICCQPAMVAIAAAAAADVRRSWRLVQMCSFRRRHQLRLYCAPCVHTDSWFNGPDGPKAKPQPNTTKPAHRSISATPPQKNMAVKSFTLAEVATHNTEKDAWIVIDGDVYDVTKFVSLHPGGKSILLQSAGPCTDVRLES